MTSTEIAYPPSVILHNVVLLALDGIVLSYTARNMSDSAVYPTIYAHHYIDATLKLRRSWWRHQMEIIFRVTGPLWGKFFGHWWIPHKRPVTRSFDVLFDLRRTKRLSKQSGRLWFETPSRSLWRHCNTQITCRWIVCSIACLAIAC